MSFIASKIKRPHVHSLCCFRFVFFRDLIAENFAHLNSVEVRSRAVTRDAHAEAGSASSAFGVFDVVRVGALGREVVFLH